VNFKEGFSLIYYHNFFLNYNIMKILLYGAKGWIGNQFLDLLEKGNNEYIKGVSRVDNNIMLEKEIKETNPTHVISFIGRTHGKINNKNLIKFM